MPQRAITRARVWIGGARGARAGISRSTGGSGTVIDPGKGRLPNQAGALLHSVLNADFRVHALDPSPIIAQKKRR